MHPLQTIPPLIDTTEIDSLKNIGNKLVEKADALATMDKEEFISTITTDASQLFTADSLEYIIRGFIGFGLKVLAAFAIYAVGMWVIRKTKRILAKVFQKKNTDKGLASFVTSLVSISLTIILIIITVGALGINTTSLAALLAAGGMAIGMAMSGTVQNFAGGIMILVFKPFKVGDFIEAQGFSGNVTGIDIFSTKLTTPDNKVIMIPNGALSNGIINNYSRQEYRRVDWVVGVEYGTDFEKAKEVLTKLINSDPRIGTVPDKPFVGIQTLNASSVDIIIKVWVKKEDYWDVFYDFNAKVYKSLPEHGIGFPFPQMDVWLRKQG